MTKPASQRLKGKIAIMNAAGQGIGRAIAARLIAEGADVHASDLDRTKLEGLSLASAEGVDAGDPEAVRIWISHLPVPDIVIHAAGWVHQGSIEECDAASWRRSMQVTLDSAYYLLAETVPRMVVRGGSVIAIASVASSIKGFPRRAAYGAAKAGVIGLIKACAADYVKQNIRFNAVCPGTVDSPSLRERIDALIPLLGSREAALQSFIDRQPAGRFTDADEVASLVALLASDEAGAMTGQALCIDAGITI